MEPCLEVDPARFAIVVGPQFTATLLKEICEQSGTRSYSKSEDALFTYDSIVQEGIRTLGETEKFRDPSERAKFEVMYKNACELDPLFALRKIAASLQEAGRYGEWLTRIFQVPLPGAAKPTPSIMQLVDLQRRGALIMYTHCDDIMSRIGGFEPAVLEDAPSAERWSRGESLSILHVHGVYSRPETVKLDCGVYDEHSHPMHDSFKELKKVFQHRNVVTIGFTSASLEDPMLARFCKSFMSQKHYFSISDSFQSVPSLLLQCRQAEEWSLGNSLMAMTDSSLALWKQFDFPASSNAGESHEMLSLMVMSKSGANEISRMMFDCPGVNFALVNSVLYGSHLIHTVSIRIEPAKLGEVWRWLVVAKVDTLLARGLFGLVLRCGACVWMKGKPLLGGSKSQPQAAAATTNNSSSSGGDREFLKALASNVTNDTHHLHSQLSDVPMETEIVVSSNGSDNSPMKTILLQKEKNAVSPLVATQDHSSNSSSATAPTKSSKKIHGGVPRYTVHKFSLKRGPPPAINNRGGPLLKSKHGFIDDSSVHASSIPKKVFDRRCSLPPMKSEERGTVIGQIAENLQSAPSDAIPPSYTAIKQALLCDHYKRRSSMQTDPITLKNLLQTKLVITDDNCLSPDLVSLRRNSDPGSYLKNRDFHRRKELFLDENSTWSRTQGSAIERKIHQWQRKRQERLHRELLWQHQKGELSPNSQSSQLKFHILNPLTGLPQGLGMLNPLQVDPSNPTTLLAAAAPTVTSGQSFVPSAYFGAAGAAAGINPFAVFPPTIVAPSTATAGAGGTNTATFLNYNHTTPFVTPYTFVNPYSTLQLTQTPPTYYIPQQNQQKLVYFVPSTATTTPPNTHTSNLVTPQLAGALQTSPHHPHPHNTINTSSHTQPQAITTAPLLSSLIAPSSSSTNSSRSSVSSPPTVKLETFEPQPVSPASRKRHQSVPEKLATLLQPPPPPSVFEDDPESPPSVKKQRSTSDTMLYYMPYGIKTPPAMMSSRHHGGRRAAGSRRSHSPQPERPNGSSLAGTLRSHLLQVPGTTTPPRQRSSLSDEECLQQQQQPAVVGVARNGYSSGGSGGGGVSGDSGSEVDEKEAEGIVGGAPQQQQQKELPVPEPRSQLQLWQFLLELLLISANSHLIQWTDSEFEFLINKPAELAELWGKCTHNPTMNYEKLARGLRYYYNKGIMKKVGGKKLSFRYAGNVRNYVQMRRSQMLSTHEEIVVVE